MTNPNAMGRNLLGLRAYVAFAAVATACTASKRDAVPVTTDGAAAAFVGVQATADAAAGAGALGNAMDVADAGSHRERPASGETDAAAAAQPKPADSKH